MVDSPTFSHAQRFGHAADTSGARGLSAGLASSCAVASDRGRKGGHDEHELSDATANDGVM